MQIHDASAPLTLVYVDDVVQRFIDVMDGTDIIGGCSRLCNRGAAVRHNGWRTRRDHPAIQATVAKSLTTERVGTGFLRALYSTYVSYLPTESFGYELTRHTDPRGSFVEMLKTQDTRTIFVFYGTPWRDSWRPLSPHMTEKFLVIKGKARFKFRQHENRRNARDRHGRGTSRDCETVPGWTHDVTNIGDEELIVDALGERDFRPPPAPDTYACPL